MIELKNLTKKALPRSLEKAERYRLLNEPQEAESICRDVLRTDPGNAQALRVLLLALTDQFPRGSARELREAREVLPRLEKDYDKVYYAGIIAERWGKARFAAAAPSHEVYEHVKDAMRAYEEAQKLSPAGNEDAVLRWNACARLLNQNPQLKPAREEGRFDSGSA